jgi:predicted CXXCH cytochrome family protein
VTVLIARRFVRTVIGAVLLITIWSLPVAQEAEDCLMCHEDPDLMAVVNGKEISAFIDADVYGASVHADFACVNCHMDLSDVDLPHEDDTERVECGMCHDQQAEEHDHSLHGRAAARGDEFAPTCSDCHGKHNILNNTDPKAPTAIMNIPLLCGKCHHEGSPVSMTHDIPQDRILENYSLSIHGEGLFQQGLTVTAVCTSCHTSHNILPHDEPDSSIHRDNVVATCTVCHGQIEQVHRKVIAGELWESEPHKIPVCVDCHSPHVIRNVFYPSGMANQDCLSCHRDETLTMERDGQTISLFVDEVSLAGFAHGDTACAQCHTGVTSSLIRACETVTPGVDCSICHAEVNDQYTISVHGKLSAEGDPDAPVCLDCHGKHSTQKKNVPSSPTFARNVPELCARCHRVGEKAAVRIDSEVPDIVKAYEMSIHGKGLVESGLIVTATCTNCHTSHGELPPADPGSSVHRDNVADTCGNCHYGIEETFKTSIHWPGNGETDKPLPTCEDCHTSHTISRVDKANFRLSMMEQCGGCHEEEAETFFDTFHGKTSRLGLAGSAKCYDCHGTHGILPPTNLASTLSRNNVVETCGKCHEGSHRQFAGYLTHATHHDSDKYPWLFWSFWGMTALLVGTLSFALIHTLAWLFRLWLSRGEWREHRKNTKAKDQKIYRRFDRYQRTLHITMMISFFTLSLTGMALKFSFMPWAQWTTWLLGGFETTGTLHRLGAVTLFIVFFTHLWQVFRLRKKKKQTWFQLVSGPDTILFTLRDLKDLIATLRWFFGLGTRPRYGRYTYWEKFDYFAVLWGVMIIGSTGLLLWFPEFFTHVIPGWFVNVATVIHSDEALLAVAFIFTVHFFNTHFRPDRFPMDPVIFTGRMTLDELKFDKPDEYEERVKDGTLDDYLVDPFPEPVEKGFKVFGFIALTIGLTLISLIVYTMLFGYR